MRTITESARQIPVVSETEVLVAGGGPAGIGAALGAARAGAKTLLVEQSNAPGGMATTGLMSHWSGSRESPLMNEIVERMAKSPSLPQEIQALTEADLKWSISHECQKAVLFQMLKESGVTVQLYTMVTDALITHADAARQRGVRELAAGGRQAMVSLQLPVLETTGVIPPGKMVRYVDGSTTRVGITRSVQVDVRMPEIFQSIEVETYA